METIGYLEHAARGHTWVVTSGVYRKRSDCEIEKIAMEPDGLGDFKPSGEFTIGGVPWIWEWKDGKLDKRKQNPQLKSYVDMLRQNYETEWGAELAELQSQFFCAISRGEKPLVYTTFGTRVKGWFRR